MKRNDHPNAKRWLRPPTIEQIDAVVKASGASETRFEIFYGLYPGCICHVRIGFRELPLKYWHIFLEDKKGPTNKSTNKPKPIPVERYRVKKNSALSNLL